MTSEADIYRSASVIMKQHGEAALEVAQARANKFWDDGDDEGAAVWTRIARAIMALQKTEAESGDSVH